MSLVHKSNFRYMLLAQQAYVTCVFESSLYICIYIYIYYIITVKFLEVAVENWPQWDLNPRSLNSVQTF